MIFDGDTDELGRYVRELADLMGLRDWTFELNVQPLARSDDADPACDPYAQIDVVYGRRYAQVTIIPGWEDATPEMLRMVVCHELIHAHLAFMGWMTNNAADVLGTTAFRVFRSGYHDAEEVAVDAIATAWAEFLPLPVKAADAAMTDALANAETIAITPAGVTITGRAHGTNGFRPEAGTIEP